MARKNSIIIKITLFSALALFVLFSCRNSLLNAIEDEVEVAVTPPEVLSIYPSESSVDIPITLNTITVTLSKAIDKDSVTSSTFYVTDPDEVKVQGRITVENETISFDPTADLIVGTVYTVTIAGITDNDGNLISETYTWSFTTGIEGDTSVPVIESVVINNGDAWSNSGTVQVDIVASDNFGVAQMNVSTTGTFSDVGWVTWAPSLSVELPEGDGSKTVYVKVKDGSGLVSTDYAQDSIGIDTVAPEITSLILEGGKSGTRNSTIPVEFYAEDEEGGSGIAAYRIRSESGAEWVDEDWTLAESGNIYIPEYSITVIENDTEVVFLQVLDAAGNESVITSESIVYDFTKPTVSSLLSNPVPNTTDNRAKSYIKIAFDGIMDTSTFTSDNIFVAKGSEKITTNSYTIVDNNTALEFTEFEYIGDPYSLEQNSSYTVVVGADVADEAGNIFETDYNYTFTNGSFEDTTAPVGKVVLNLDDPENNATAGNTFNLQIKAEDDYNGVRAVKIWGDNNLTDPVFESDASWILYTEGPTTGGGIVYMDYGSPWGVNLVDDDYFIYYRFVDYAYNESTTPGILKVSLDSTDPVLNSIFITGGIGFTNNSEDTVDIFFDAVDTGSGLTEMWYTVVAGDTENLPSTNSGTWQEWSSMISGYTLDSGEGQYFIYGEVKDKVGLLSGTTTGFAESTSFILDYTVPTITFETDDLIETNGIALQTSSISDDHPVGTELYHIASGIASYDWEQVLDEGTGTGTLGFYSDSAGETEDATVPEPYVKVLDGEGSEDGSYKIKVTVTDNAGNSAYNTVDFIWDTLNPADVELITGYVDVVVDEATGTTEAVQFAASTDTQTAYTNSAVPYITWEATDGADFYTMIISNEVIDPNSPPGVLYGVEGWYPHWDDTEVDWDDPATWQEKNYMKSDEPFMSAPTPDTIGNNDGLLYIYAVARDNAGNRSGESTDSFIKFWIDTLSPVIVNINDIAPKKEGFTLNYHNSDDLGDGRVYDQRTSNDPVQDDAGSGIATYAWAQSDGPGTLTITGGDGLTPTIEGPADGIADGQYTVALTATDHAGNSTTGAVSFEWDTIAPYSPVISALSHTPNRLPTWTWSAGGNGGNGTYRYKLEKIGRHWDDHTTEPGVYYGTAATVVDWTVTTDLNYIYEELGVPVQLDDEYEYTLYVQERDVAGNWSDSAEKAIWIDTHYTSEPTVVRDGEYLRNGDPGARNVTWNFTTGLGAPATERYRYRIKNDAGGYEYPSTGDWITLADNVSTVSHDFESSDDDIYILEVNEYNIAGGDWVKEADDVTPKVGTSSVQTDSIAPGIPAFYSKPGTVYPGQDDSTYYLTGTTSPYFYWHTGGDGNGDYRWRVNSGIWNYTRYRYISPSMTEGVYIFEVQESDLAGNWSDSLVHKFEIDTTGPTLTSITLKNRSSNAVDPITYSVSQYVDIDVSASGVNNQTFSSGDIRYMRFTNSGGTITYRYDYATTKSYWSLATGVTLLDGWRTVSCELEDYAGNVSVVKSDNIYLDRESPSVTDFSINSDADVTYSTTAILNSTLSGAAKMRYSLNGGSTWSSWVSDSTYYYTYNAFSSVGAKRIIVQYTDWAGWYSRSSVDDSAPSSNTVQVEDGIFYGRPEIQNATKGYTTNGSIDVYYDYPVDSGLDSNTYEIWYSDEPNGGPEYQLGSTTGSTYYGTINTGTAYYLYLRVYNPDIGYTDYSSNDALCYSSNVVIIYNPSVSSTPTDLQIGNTLRSRILTDWSSGAYSDIYTEKSTYPDFSITMIPYTEVPNTYEYVTAENSTRIYGDPVIVTPYNYYLYQYENRVRNVAEGSKGLFAMYYYGSLLFEQIVSKGAEWEAENTPNYYAPITPLPTGLAGVPNTGNKGLTQDIGLKYYNSSSNFIWHKYAYHNNTYDNYRYDEEHEITIFSPTRDYTYGEAYRFPIENYNNSGTGGVYFWADDPVYPNFYTVVRQGKYVYWAYDRIPAYANAGLTFLDNIVRFLYYDRYLYE